MGGGRGAGCAASRGSHWRRSGLLGSMLALLVVGSVAGGRSQEGQEPIRAVRSSLAATPRALTLSTASLYAKNDPWQAYLASETVCPGGERTDLSLEAQTHTVACLVNFARRRRGLRELAVVSILNGASARKANAIVRCANFAHNPCGGDWRASVMATGYRGYFGENLYLASGPWGAPRVAVDAWLNSAPHRETLFQTRWREQGLALVKPDSFADRRDLSLWVSVLAG